MQQALSKVIAGPGRGALRIGKRLSLREMAVERVRAAIRGGTFQPGERVTELGLAAQLGVAQATVREALVELEAQGFVQRRGAHRYITELSPRDVDDIYAVRERLEMLAAELVSKAEHADLTGVRKACEAMQEAAALSDRVKAYDADLAFHRAVWAAGGNLSLVDSLERLVPKLFAFGIIRHTHLTKGDLSKMAELHWRLLELMERRETKAVVALTRESMAQAREDDTKACGGG